MLLSADVLKLRVIRYRWHRRVISHLALLSASTINVRQANDIGMTAWLVGQYAQGKLRLEDLGTANETLMMFRRYAPRLEIRQRDLGRYQNLAAVWDAVIGFA